MLRLPNSWLRFSVSPVNGKKKQSKSLQLVMYHAASCGTYTVNWLP